MLHLLSLFVVLINFTFALSSCPQNEQGKATPKDNYGLRIFSVKIGASEQYLENAFFLFLILEWTKILERLKKFLLEFIKSVILVGINFEARNIFVACQVNHILMPMMSFSTPPPFLFVKEKSILIKIGL